MKSQNERKNILLLTVLHRHLASNMIDAPGAGAVLSAVGDYLKQNGVDLDGKVTIGNGIEACRTIAGDDTYILERSLAQACFPGDENPNEYHAVKVDGMFVGETPGAIEQKAERDRLLEEVTEFLAIREAKNAPQ